MLGLIQSSQGDLKDGIVSYRKAIALDPQVSGRLAPSALPGFDVLMSLLFWPLGALESLARLFVLLLAEQGRLAQPGPCPQGVGGRGRGNRCAPEVRADRVLLLVFFASRFGPRGRMAP